MLYIFGIRFARIGNYIDNDQICYPCKAYDREIKVYRSYFHFCFIPVFPMGGKRLEIRCKNCGDETRVESIVKKYEKSAKTPWYLYSAIILFVGLASFWFYWNKNAQKHKIEYVGNPVASDVYTISKEENYGTTYYFLKIAAMRGDSVMMLHSHLEYGGFVSNLAYDDYFVKDDTAVYSRKELRQMLERGEIYSVKRNP
ncbi:MAG TPA: zinc-ribbon domain-containing protein [Puia sp.]|nr:zinc-ribbon domain-containing protein [Puia sp.]